MTNITIYTGLLKTDFPKGFRPSLGDCKKLTENVKFSGSIKEVLEGMKVYTEEYFSGIPANQKTMLFHYMVASPDDTKDEDSIQMVTWRFYGTPAEYKHILLEAACATAVLRCYGTGGDWVKTAKDLLSQYE